MNRTGDGRAPIGKAGRMNGRWLTMAWLFLAVCAGPAGSAPAGTAKPAGVEKGEEPFSWLIEDINGFVRVRTYHDVDRDWDPEYIGEWRLELPLRLSSNSTARLSGDARVDYGVVKENDGTGHRHFDLYEAYLDSDWGVLRIRYGRQFIRWGKGDEVNPVDNFTPEDLTEALNLDRADRKIPAWAVYPKIFMDKFVWEAIYQPVFAANPVGVEGERWEPFVARNYRSMGFQILRDAPPDKVFEDSVWATRLVYQGAFGDVSLGYAYHFEESPAYKVLPNPSYRPGVPEPPAYVQPVHERVHSVGTDFETATHGWTFREETVFTTDRPYVTYDRSDLDAIVQKDAITSLVGIDHTFPGDIYVNLQLIQEFILGREKDMQPDAYESSVTFRVWQFFLRQKLKAQLTGRYYLTESDYFWKANVEYEYTDNLKLDAGYMVFGGDETGLFGQFDGNDQVYAVAKYSF